MKSESRYSYKLIIKQRLRLLKNRVSDCRYEFIKAHDEAIKLGFYNDKLFEQKSKIMEAKHKAYIEALVAYQEYYSNLPNEIRNLILERQFD